MGEIATAVAVAVFTGVADGDGVKEAVGEAVGFDVARTVCVALAPTVTSGVMSIDAALSASSVLGS